MASVQVENTPVEATPALGSPTVVTGGNVPAAATPVAPPTANGPPAPPQSLELQSNGSRNLDFSPSPSTAPEQALDFGQDLKTIPDAAIPVRAAKYSFAMGEHSPGINVIVAQLAAGQDDMLRDNQVKQNALDFQRNKIGMLNDLIKNSPDGVNPDTAGFALGITQADYNENPSNVMETTFARKYMATIAARDTNQSFAKTEVVDPELANSKLDIGEWAVARNQIAQTVLEETQQQIAQQGMGSWLGDIVMGNFVPLASVRLNNLVKSPSITSSLPGNNMQEQINYLHTLNPDEFSKQLRAAAASEPNLQLRQQFLSGVMQQSDSANNLTNLGAVADIAMVFQTATEAGKIAKGVMSLGKAVGKAASAATKDSVAIQAARTGASPELVQSLNSTIRSAVTASKDVNLDLGKLAGDTGDFKSAAVVNSMKTVDPNIPIRDEDIIRNNALSINGGGNRWFTGDGPNLAGQTTRDFLDVTKSSVDDFFNGPTVARVEDAQRVANRQALYDTTITGNDKSIQGSVLDVDSSGHLATPESASKDKFFTQQNNLTNTESIHISLGRKNGELFPNKGSAVKFAQDNLSHYDLDLTGTSDKSNLVPFAGKYYLRLDLDAPDALDNFKDLAVPTNDRMTTSFFDGMLKGVLGRSRNQGAALGDVQATARKVVAHGNQRLYQVFQKIVKPIEALSKDERKRLGQILENNRDYVDRSQYDASGNPVRGQFFQSRLDFENAYRSKWNQLPSEKETLAYYSYVQANQLDGMVRNGGWARDKIRLGIKQWKDNVTHDYDMRGNLVSDPGTSVPSTKRTPLNFEGKQVHSLPGHDDPNTTIALRKSDGTIEFIPSRYMGPKQKALIEKELNKGATIIQAADGHLPIPGAGKDTVVSHYITGSAKEGRISIAGPWKDGGHVLNEHGFYIKQPTVRGGYYAGDVSVATAPNAKVALQRSQAFETARNMMLRGDSKLDEFVSREIGNGMNGADFADLFKGKRTVDGVERQGLDPNAPFLWTQSGERTLDRHKLSDFVKQGDNPYNLYQLDRNFSGERGPNNIPALIDEKNTRILYEDGKLIDPFETLTQAAKSMVDVRLKRDYVLKSANQWVSQFRDILQGGTDTLRRDAMQNLYNPQYLKSVDKTLLNNAENARRSILRFSGSMAGDEATFETLKSKMAEIAYGTLGDKNFQVAENWLLPTLKNPAVVARSFAFHLKLGLFAPTQLLMQAQTAVNILGISPRAALKGLPAYFPLRVALLNPNMLEHSAGVASKFGWDVDHFKEMYGALVKSGWSQIKGDVAVLDDIANPSLFRSTKGKILDAGTVFFSEGEKVHRLSGWATAYQEWRTANPVADLDRAAEHWILNRTDNLTANMSAANNANWQRGLLAIPAQFFTYQLRLMEQYIGKTLSTPEKLRLFAVQAATYGIPTAAGGAVGVWPIFESTKDYLISQNIPHDDVATQALLNGIPQVLLRLATGSNIDVGARFGQGGIDAGYQLLRGEKSIWQIAGGAGGSVLGDVLSTSIPFLKGIYGQLNADPNSPYSPLDATVMNRVTENITSVNGVEKMWYAMNTGRWMSMYGVAQDEVTPFQAIFMGLTGAKLTDLNEMFNKKGIEKERKDLSTETQKDVMDYLRRGMQPNQDPKDTREYMTIAHAHAVAGGLTPQEEQRCLQNVLAGVNETEVDEVARKFTLDAAKRGYPN